ncbi:MAG: T6SS immunity protein Tdi1 domain-containing protein [Telluria sp.]
MTQQVTDQALTINDLTVSLSRRQATADIFSEWTWLIGPEKRPLRLAACGGVFVEDSRDGVVHFLDVSAVQLSYVAESPEAFERLLSQPALFDAYLCSERVARLRRHGLLLKQDQIYSLRVPLSLGGDVSVENTEIADIDVHFSIAGQIECQIANTPVGTQIGHVVINQVRRPTPWWKFW